MADLTAEWDSAKPVKLQAEWDRATPTDSVPNPSDTPTEKKAAEPSLADRIKRQVMLTPRALADAATGMIALPGTILDAVSGAVDSTGILPAKLQKFRSNELLQAGLDAIGLPKPETPVERVANLTAGGMAGAAGMARMGTALAANSINPTAARVGEVMAANPEMQIASGATGGAGSGVVRENGGGPMAQMAGGLAGAFVPAVAARAGAAVLRPVESFATPEQQALHAQAEKMGFTLSSGTKTDNGRLKSVESTLKNAPGGGEFQAIQRKNAEVMAQKALETVGETGTAVTPEVLSKATGRIGGVFNRIVGNNNIVLGDDFLNKLGDIESKYTAVWNKSDELAKVIDKALEATSTGVLTGKEYQNIRRALQVDSVAKIKAGDANSGKALSALAEALDDAAARSVPPKEMAEWNQARQQYRNLITLYDATTGNVNAKAGVGTLEPAQLANAVVNNRGRRVFARTPIGSGDDLVDLARVGAGIRDLVPNSGTAERNYWLHLLGGGTGAVLGAMAGGPAGAAVGQAAGVAVPFAASKAITSDVGRHYLERGFLPSLQGPLSRAPTVPMDALIENVARGQ